MTELKAGTFKLRQWVGNPEPVEHSEDWRHKKGWEGGTKFHCFRVYLGMGQDVWALYLGSNPGTMVHQERMPNVYKALLDYLEPA